MTIKEYTIAYSKQYRYFSIEDLKRYLTNKNVKFSPRNLKTYLYILKKQELVYKAGRGWYSVISKELNLNIDPVEKIVDIIKKKFPEIKFSSWSTKQLKDFFHHLPFYFITFVYTEKEFMVYIKELLQSEGFNVYENPLKREAEKFLAHRGNTLILRPLVISRGKIDECYSKTEKILIDLYMERQKLNLMDEEEYKRILIEILSNYRINMAEMLDYAHNRKIKKGIYILLYKNRIIPIRHFDKMSQK